MKVSRNLISLFCLGVLFAVAAGTLLSKSRTEPVTTNSIAAEATPAALVAEPTAPPVVAEAESIPQEVVPEKEIVPLKMGLPKRRSRRLPASTVSEPASISKEEASPTTVNTIPPTKQTLFDRVVFSPTFNFLLVNTTRSSDGQQVQLASTLSAGFSMKLEQNWSEDFQTSVHMDYSKYSLSNVAGVSSENLDGSFFDGAVEARWKPSDRWSYGGTLGLADEMTVTTDGTSLMPMKLTAPSVGAFVGWSAWKSEMGSVDLIPHLNYIASAKNGSATADAHLAYGLGIEANKLSHKFFSSTGLAMSYEQSSFNSSAGKNVNAFVQIRVNLGFDF